MDDNADLDRLLSQAREGDERSLAELIEHLRARLRSRAQGLLGPRLDARLDASDVAQEVCFRVHEGLEGFTGQAGPQLLAWAEKILQNVITDCRRHHGAGRRDAGVEVAGGDLFPGLAGDGSTPSQGVMRHEEQAREQARLAKALERLPEKQRLTFQLRMQEGLPFEEVARRVGVTEVHARVLMLRAMTKLKKELGDEA